MRTIPFLALIFLLAIHSAPTAAQSLPNIVVILADDMGYGDVQVLNPDSTIPTPNLNRLAEQGMLFTDAHTPSAVCTPTRYGLLTGRYCWRSSLKKGVLGGYSPPLLEEGRTTIADLLASRGYRTRGIGKWHLGMQLPTLGDAADTTRWDGDPGIDFSGVIANSPIHHGFEHYFGVSASLDMAPYVYIRDDRFTQLPSIQQKAVSFPHFIRSGPRSEDFVVDEVLDRLTDEATATIRALQPGEAPYFLYLALTGPHKPTQPEDRFRGKTNLGEYGDFVHQVDWTVGQVMQAIADGGEMDNTLVIFTSDNGSYMYRYDDPETTDHVEKESVQGYRPEHHRANGPLRGTKADIWEAGHRVPFIARLPQTIAPGSCVDATICLTDIYATLAEITGTPPADGQAEDSYSILSTLRGESIPRGAPVVHHSVGGMFALRDGRWKLIAGNGSGGREKPSGQAFAQPYQLYDLQADLAEANDLAAQHPEIVQRLTDALEALRH